MGTKTRKDKEVGNIVVGFECNKCGYLYADNSLPSSWIELENGTVYCPACLKEEFVRLYDLVNEGKLFYAQIEEEMARM